MRMTEVTIHNRTLQFSLEITRYLQSFATTTISSVLLNQVMRSACSIGANVVEAQNSATKKEFRRYLQISLRSARETEYWLTILKRN
ncbi:four helix bundle protein [Patescibacteria group bacterium]|nr:four helix bundle protein [Patescibacteria group bacterium]MBU1890126.1 four helix bundle protein [Patescibacteria group bacterium]